MTDHETGAPTPAWSCWALSTVMAALLEAGGSAPAPVAAVRRTDDRAPVVDVHSVVVAPDGDATVICDPYFGAVLPGPGEAEQERRHLGTTARRVDEPEGRWSYEVDHARWGAPLRYRVLAPTVDPGDVHAFCVVSVTHSGVPPGPIAALRWPDRSVDAFTHGAGGHAVREWRPDGDGPGATVVTEHADWDSTRRDFGARTGVALA